MQGYDLYGEVFAKELESRFATPEFQNRVSLLGLLRGRVRRIRADRRAIAERRVRPADLIY